MRRWKSGVLRSDRGTDRLNSELALAKSTAEDANISKTRFLAAASHDILQRSMRRGFM